MVEAELLVFLSLFLSFFSLVISLLLNGFLVELGVIAGSGRKWRVLEGGRFGEVCWLGGFFTAFSFSSSILILIFWGVVSRVKLARNQGW